jgi:Zn-finger nucleic acid-binding protein
MWHREECEECHHKAVIQRQRCSTCGAVALNTADLKRLFYRRTRKGKPAGYRETCKDCSKSAASAYQAAHPESWDRWRTWNERKRATKEPKPQDT